MDIVEVRIAYLGIPIPSIHRIDGLRQLCTALFINAASVHPHPLIPVLLHQLACIQELLIAEAMMNFISIFSIHLCEIDHLLIIHFLSIDPLVG